MLPRPMPSRRCSTAMCSRTACCDGCCRSGTSAAGNWVPARIRLAGELLEDGLAEQADVLFGQVGDDGAGHSVVGPVIGFNATAGLEPPDFLFVRQSGGDVERQPFGSGRVLVHQL